MYSCRYLKPPFTALLMSWSVALSPHSAAEPTTALNDHIQAKHLTVEFVQFAPALAPGGTIQIGLKLNLEEGWHVYWSNAGDSGQPPSLEWALPNGITAGTLQFPVPKRLPLGSLVDYGYEGVVTFPVRLDATQELRPGRVPLIAKLKWLVCREICIPGSAQLGTTLLISTESRPNTFGNQLTQTLNKLPKKLPAALTISVSGEPTQFVLTLSGAALPARVQFYPLDQDEVANAANQTLQPTTNGLQLRVERASASSALPPRLHGLLKFAEDEAYEIDAPVTPASPLANSPGGRGELRMATLVAVGLGFLGGIFLNLMPCVFPVLFLKGLALVQSSSEERGRLRRHGLMYSLGILVSFWCLVAVLLVLRATGSQAGWGFQLQSPLFVALLACLLFFLALSLAGQFDFGLSMTAKGGSLAHKQGYLGSFFTGVLATVVATPCMGPFLGSAIGFALAEPVVITFAVFTATALGLAFPYMLLTAQPAAIRALPRPAAWMEIFKQLTAVPIFATVIWLTWIYMRLFAHAPEGSSGHIVRLLSGFLILAIAGWVLGRWPARWFSTATALVLSAITLATLIAQPKLQTLEWQPFSEAALNLGRAQHRPVFIDFTAAWCLSCQFNERTVLDSAEITQQLSSRNFVLLKADWTANDPEITKQLAEIGRSGVPAYVIYPSAPDQSADVLPEVLTKSGVLRALQRDSD